LNADLSPEQVLDLLRAEDALLEGHFLLSSGLRSDRYFQCALALANPVTAGKLAEALVTRLPERPELVVGPAMGAVVWAQEVARALGCRAFFTERVDGTFALRRGFRIEPGTRVLVVEDVVTTGGSAKEVIALLRELGARVIGVGSIVNRSGGQPFEDLDLPLTALAEVTARTWSADDVPAEFAGSEPVKPGSRPTA
jgi:orotate phosphoribosyltransferase